MPLRAQSEVEHPIRNPIVPRTVSSTLPLLHPCALYPLAYGIPRSRMPDVASTLPVGFELWNTCANLFCHAMYSGSVLPPHPLSSSAQNFPVGPSGMDTSYLPPPPPPPPLPNVSSDFKEIRPSSHCHQKMMDEESDGGGSAAVSFLERSSVVVPNKRFAGDRPAATHANGGTSVAAVHNDDPTVSAGRTVRSVVDGGTQTSPEDFS
ncbi:unnamed protein product [Soboliphyme baturini]|uniref:Uncharacterized protein n=1 Tax=Soboliphyme baturini TaxID=241478 RepID=A0A183IE75_9BILA|nr:unnamed protein product [Soboliphyme baturini]